MTTTTLTIGKYDVARIGYGALWLSQDVPMREGGGIRLLHSLFDLRTPLFVDTADAYCRDTDDFHHNELLIAEALSSYQGDTSHIVVGTKGGQTRPDGYWKRCGDPKYIEKTLQQSAEIFGGSLQLWQLHAPDPEFDIRKTLEPVAAAFTEGVVEHVGLCNVSIAQIEQAREVVPITTVQNNYNLWVNRAFQNEVITHCENQDIVFLGFSPFGSRRKAALVRDIPELAGVSEQCQLSTYQLLLLHYLSHSNYFIPLVGTTSIEHFSEALTALNSSLPEGIQTL